MTTPDADTIEYLRAALARTNADYAALLKTSIEALEAAIRLRSALEAVQRLLPKNGTAAALIDAALAGTPPLEVRK